MAFSISAGALAVVMTMSTDIVDAGPMHLLVVGPRRVFVIAAIAGALRRLESPSCQRVLTDFTDQSGRSLADNLAATGLTLSSFVSRLYATEGDRERGCAKDVTRAFTAPGSRVIFVCSSHFDQKTAIVDAQMTIIHEILHTLGLGENPPSSLQITRQVTARCRTSW
jgi:hypothetical protein